ncbi:serine threonine protein kinase : WD40 repeat-containing protein OS=Singulisphaera acidiphila (strain ATCC BAA-1392 / DSM 18658 / VKM B-2454 / MOB10) GN=Sinac_7396 PE=3 SV=1: Pkinase: WD40 [Gemmataceae bacterium]|nr:serine threonine protein kinase : WD40 repeat-containing protein OS=Singulisphaera acidiphila (strain ATCC BAA-1392 / DSM 18658 / VKM B-2454 / MOB10) GN=Sinac_7396 PE=3 SV=1: Pkinase: WD40 [Gemmataceae bacterium]VTU00359.1 serine threonine protein kinase : WD40 repeat-containing protein OS=Singulisphaera acidiphila (strain ATCC BAA-1392 / DSM 18658 / VKM B-2454 / MOB10) GN=Sinac_7396 PE=3 SV=1: Pkinase: WD40 [Gemmataceae bacterium]
MIPDTRPTSPDPAAGPARPAAWPEVPGYQIVGEVGRGGMGVVYKARQVALNRFVAVKMICTDADDVDDRIRFLGEAESVAAIQHPNVVQIHAFGQADDRPYLVMEFVAGGSLAALLKECPRLPPRAAAALVAKVARGVQAAHEAGIIHRDLKPANILLGGDEVARVKEDTRADDDPFAQFPAVSLSPARLRPKVTDFGLARGMLSGGVSQAGVAVGTPAYMAPEQAKCQVALLGPGTDVHALGVVLYECLTGRLPFEADTAEKILRVIADRDAPRVRFRAPAVPQDLDLIVAHCLEKHPADRYPTAAALADDLDRFLADEPVSVARRTPAERVAYQIRRHPAYALGALSVVLGAFAAVATVLWFQADARRVEAEEALREARDARQRADAEHGHAEEAKAEAEFALAVRATEQAVREVRGGNLARARQLLAGCPERFRAWEWHYASRQLSLSKQDARELALAQRWRRLFAPPESVALPGCPAVARLALSADARHLALLSDDTLSVVDSRTAATLASVRVPAGCRELAFTADGSVVVLVAANGSERLWEWGLPAGLRPSGVKSPPVAADVVIDSTALAVRRDGELAATGAADGVVRICDAGTGANARRVAGHRGRVTGVAFHPDGARLASVGADGIVRLWDVRTGVDVLTLEVPAPATAVSWSPDGSKLAVATSDLVRIFDATPPRE